MSSDQIISSLAQFQATNHQRNESARKINAQCVGSADDLEPLYCVCSGKMLSNMPKTVMMIFSLGHDSTKKMLSELDVHDDLEPEYWRRRMRVGKLLGVPQHVLAQVASEIGMSGQVPPGAVGTAAGYN